MNSDRAAQVYTSLPTPIFADTPCPIGWASVASAYPAPGKLPAYPVPVVVHATPRLSGAAVTGFFL
jgi:hypothetical protein